MPGKSTAGSPARASVEVTLRTASDSAKSLAQEIASSADRRRAIPVRKSFVQASGESKPPLARLVARGGRGGGVPVKLYLALIWRCSAKPFTTDISARKWAALLDLEDPNTLGARRITEALNVLESEGLIKLIKRRGEPSIIRLCEESGLGNEYSLPSTAHALARDADKPRHRYLKVPDSLWTDGLIQHMSGPAVAMLLILLAEQQPNRKRIWWSTTEFPSRYRLTSTARSKGTTELEILGLLSVQRQLVSKNPEVARQFTRERVRNTYLLRGAAYPYPDEPKRVSRRKAVPRKAIISKSLRGGSPER